MPLLRARRNGLPRSQPGADLEARLALLEFLLQGDDLEACAQHAMTWLVKHGGVEQAACIAIDAERRRLIGVAGEGIPFSQVAEFSLELSDAGHPLVEAFSTGGPVYFASPRPEPATPLGKGPFHVTPLSNGRTPASRPLGLLLTSAGKRTPAPETLWLASVLGSKLSLLSDGPSERQWSRERSLLLSLINAVTDPMLLTDTEGRLIVANARAEKLFMAPDDVSEGWRRAVALNNMLFSSSLTASSIQQAATSPREILLVDPIDGSDLLYELILSSVRDPREGTRLVSILRNVTDLKKAMVEIEENYRKLCLAEGDVRAERHRLDLIIDSVADPIVVTDPTGETLLMNAPAERLFTLKHTNVREALQRVRANDAHFSSFVSNLLSSGSDRHWREQINLQDPSTARPMPVEAVAGKILNEQGELTAIVTILHDLTEAIEKARLYEELKKASGELEVKVQEATAELADQNELLRRQALELEQASALKSQFLANMSHEFRTPLNAILGYTNMLLQGISGELLPLQKKNLTRIDSNGRHLLAIINEILDITRIEAGKMPLNLSTFPVPELVSEVLGELEAVIVRSKLVVHVKVSPELPPIHSDRQKVKQILVNLISNALKFTHQGRIRLAVRYLQRGRMVSIAVTDTGIGIPEADFDKVFEDFRQLDNSPSRGHGGTGLGLSISRRLAGMLQGRITLESRVGRGSRFTLYLPRRSREKKGEGGGIARSKTA